MIEPIVGADRVRANVTLRLNSKTEEETTESLRPGQRRAQPSDHARGRRRERRPAASPVRAATFRARRSRRRPRRRSRRRARRRRRSRPARTGRQAETVNYEVGKKTTRSIVPRGDVARLSVAVVVDNARQAKTDAEGKVTRTSTPRPQAEMQKIQQLVAAAVGLDADRGDQLIVENVSFDEPVDEPVAAPTLFERVGGGAQTWARPAIVLVVGLVALLFVLRPIVRGVFSYAPPPPPPPAPTTRVETQPLPGQLPKTIEEVEQNIEAELDAKLADHLSHRKTPVLQRRVVRAIEAEPENAARLVRAWLLGGRGMSVKGFVTAPSGVRKAAILTLMVGESTAAAMFKHLSEDEIEKIAREVAVVGQIAPDNSAATLEEFHTMWRASEYVTRGGVEYAQKLLIKTLGAGHGAPRPRSRRQVVRVDGRVLQPRARRPAAALEVRAERAPADDRAAARAPQAGPGRAARQLAARRSARRGHHAHGDARRDLARRDEPRVVGHRGAAEVARHPGQRVDGRRPRRRRAAQPPRSRRQHRGARRRSRTSRRTWRCRSAT